jgi:hypothetical protein
MSVYLKIAAISRALSLTGIAKKHENKQQGWFFRSVDDVYNILSPLLVEQELLMLPRVLTRSCTQQPTKNNGTLFYVVLEVEYDLVSAADGTVHTIKVFGEAMDSGDKATGKAMSAAYKSATIQAFCVPVSGAPDPDAESHEVTVPIAASAVAGPAPAPVNKIQLNTLLAATKEKVGVCATHDGLNALWIQTIAGLDVTTQEQLKAIFKNRKKAITEKI